MTTLKNLLLAFTVMGASVAAHASDDNFSSPAFDQNNRLKKANALNFNYPYAAGVIQDSAWGVRLAQQNSRGHYDAGYDKVSGTYNGIKLRQENLLGVYDLSDPVGGSAHAVNLWRC
ncbi:hypothetical protein D3C73_831840 [compost metagenome]